MGYQIDFFSRSYENIEAKDLVILMANRANDLLTGRTYKLTRVGAPTLAPLLSDKSVMRYSLRYECSILLDTNTIYKRS